MSGPIRTHAIIAPLPHKEEPIHLESRPVPPPPIKATSATLVYIPDPPKKRKIVIWDNEQVIGEIQKSDNVKLVAKATTRAGTRYIVMIEYYRTALDEFGKWHAGNRLSMPLQKPINHGEQVIRPYESMLLLIAEAAKYAETMPLVDHDKQTFRSQRKKD